MSGYKLSFERFQKQKGLSDNELARRLNRSRSYVSQLKNRSSIDFETLHKLCRVLDVEPKDIIVEYEVKV